LRTRTGLVQVYTGDGKGKTTAALGLALRAIGHGYKVAIVQFMKGRDYGEKVAIERWLPGISIYQCGRDAFVDKRNPDLLDITLAQEGMGLVKNIVREEKYDMLILDEINVAVDYGLVSESQVIEVIETKPLNLELVLTGRNASPLIIERADLVSEVKEIKHYYRKGIISREGIEW